MQIENDYDKEVYNGDIGYIADIDPEAGELTASFDGRAVTYGRQRHHLSFRDRAERNPYS
jgi:ATP-dependent exoDNAse (exonuclease V) alpha subunit